MSSEALHGLVPHDLVDVANDAVQCSPRVPGALALDALAPGSLTRLVLIVPANVPERRRALALGLRALAAGGELIALGHNTKGGNRIADELAAFGCAVDVGHKHHHRIAHTLRPAAPTGLEDAIADGAARLLPDLGLWSEPGLFSWDRIDPGSRLLLDHLPALTGRGADLGCGIGVLARAVLAHPECTHLTLVDIDRRALDLTRRNVARPDATSALWTDLRAPRDLPTGLDFVVMNPPFHDGGEEDRALGRAFIERAAAMLMPGGALWLTANRHLPYEATLGQLFAEVEIITQAGGYKIFAARKATGRNARGGGQTTRASAPPHAAAHASRKPRGRA